MQQLNDPFSQPVWAIYTDFYQLDNLGLVTPDYFNGKHIFQLEPEVMQQITSKPCQALKRVLALDPVLEVALLDPLLKRAQELFYSAPYQERGVFAHAGGMLQYFLYATHAGLMYYLAHARKVKQARSAHEKISNGLIYLTISLVSQAVNFGRKVTIRGHEQIYPQHATNLQAWITQLTNQFYGNEYYGSKCYGGRYSSGVDSTTLNVKVHWQELSALNSEQSKQLAAHYINALISPALQKTLTALELNWRNLVLTQVMQADPLSHLNKSMEYGHKVACETAQKQLKVADLAAQQAAAKQEYLSNTASLIIQVLEHTAREHGKQYLVSYLTQALAYWQLQQAEIAHPPHGGNPKGVLEHHYFLSILYSQLIADYNDLQWSSLLHSAKDKYLKSLWHEYQQLTKDEL
ncbi:hypothetical protein [Psittacicella hinzii]|uniref:Uncharacterized protein n=1 Tax=Psittacicella hinzii TaxID=2028575 RepID=A0A3A1YN23_9GAMM|nr:hypothetical protein [Psittacicella hinzii]RIY38629.1 hypothetical protein CKF58_03755 [Psittacicella hinzii]